MPPRWRVAQPRGAPAAIEQLIVVADPERSARCGSTITRKPRPARRGARQAADRHARPRHPEGDRSGVAGRWPTPARAPRGNGRAPDRAPRHRPTAGCWPRCARCRASASCPRSCAEFAYRRRPAADRRRADDLAALHRRRDDRGGRGRARRPRARGRRRLGLRRRGAVADRRRGLRDRAPRGPGRARPRRGSPSSATTTVE